jgi:hypothetical protein
MWWKLKIQDHSFACGYSGFSGHLLKRPSFIHWMVFVPLTKISWPCRWMPISWFFILFHWTICMLLYQNHTFARVCVCVCVVPELQLRAYTLSHSISPFLWRVFFSKIGSHQFICLGWRWTAILLISASWVARITGVNYCWPAEPHYFDYYNFVINLEFIEYKSSDFEKKEWV